MSVRAHASTVANVEYARLRTLYQLLAALSQARGLEDVYNAALETLLEATSADRAAILLFDEDGVMRFKASRGLSDAYQTAVTGHSPWIQGARDAHPQVVQDVLSNEDLLPYRDALNREGIRAMAFVPLTLDAGVLGKFMLYYNQPHQWALEELEMAQAVAAHVALAAQQKRAENERLRVEQRLQAILDNSSAIIFLKDLKGRYLLVNRRYEELFRVDRGQILGRTDYDFFPPEIAERFRANDESVIAAGRPMAIEEHAPHEDGMHTYVSLKFPLEEIAGQVTGICGIATDITERKRLEADSRHLAAIVESSEDAIISKDLNGVITSWNRGAERLFGYTAAEVLGLPVSILAAPGHSDEMPSILAKIRNGEHVDHFETRRRKKSGEIIDVALSVSPVRDSDGTIAGASKIARDITDRKRVEEERSILLAREQDARRTAELLNLVGPRLASQLDVEKLVQEVTDIATTLVGAEFGSLFHNVLNEKGESYMLYTLSGVPREAFANFPMPRNTSLFGPTFRGEGIVRCEDVTKDPRYGNNPPHHGMPKGHLPVKSYLAAPVITRSGEVLGGLFFGHSMAGKFTETHEAIVAGIAAQAAIAIDNARLFEQSQWIQTELKRSNEELRRANQDLEVFAYSASHDLREPLRTIAISAQLMERGMRDQLKPRDATLLTDIRAAANRMTVLIEDLLSYTKATRYEEGPTPRIESGKVLTEVLATLRAPIEEAGAVITTTEMPAVAIHESRLAQLFQNLISNALKYRSKEVTRVHIAGDDRDGWCTFSVVDNGIGIEPQFAEQIFGLFKRLHGSDEYPGSGIGLAICQRIVEQYGGRIWLEQSAPGRGSTFCFAIPSRS